MYVVLSRTTNDIITAVLDCVVSHVMRKCCDCVVHESEVWIKISMTMHCKNRIVVLTKTFVM